MKKHFIPIPVILSDTASFIFFQNGKNTDSAVVIINVFDGQEFCPKHYLITTRANGTMKNRDISTKPAGPKFLKVHGKVNYDFVYRSGMENSLVETEYVQHTERIHLNALIREEYPLRISFAARQGNSTFFRDFLDLNLQFDPLTYQKKLKQKIHTKLESGMLPEERGLDSLKKLIEERTLKYSRLKQWLESPATLQKLIELKEEKFKEYENRGKDLTFNSALSAPNIPVNDTLFNLKTGGFAIEELDFLEEYNIKRQEVPAMEKLIRTFKLKGDSLQYAIQKKKAALGRKIHEAKSSQEIFKLAGENDIPLEFNDRLSRHLSSIKSLSIGKSFLDYTELTAKNITIRGINAEYNSGIYGAIVMGKIDRHFKDFFYNRKTALNQHVIMGRLGVGDIERKAVILTAFKGSKNSAFLSLSDSAKKEIQILGYSLEAIYKLNSNTGVRAEIAKSIKPGNDLAKGDGYFRDLWNWGDKTNMGLNIKAENLIPETRTKINGFYRTAGEGFESFSLFSYNTNQTAWSLKVDQPFYKRRINLIAILRQNDFTNPFTDKTFKTSATFKSVILNAQIPKWPSLSLGYFPGTQLYVVNKERIQENAYYVLNGSVIYFYSIGETKINSTVIFNRFFNKATESGFVQYKGINYYTSQTVFFNKIQLQGGYSFNKQTELQYYTLESSFNYQLKEKIKINLGLKYNKTSLKKEYWGQRVQISFDLKHLGGLQFQYEKSYLPSLTKSLFPVESCRISWYKSF